jgi:FixJ family two-component response regulator
VRITAVDRRAARPLVAVVDDSDSVRESLPDLLGQVGLAVRAFDSAEAFLESGVAGTARCLLLDVGLPGMSGPDLQRELVRRGQTLPIVFITAHGDKSLEPRLLAAGAAACLFKPFSDTALIAAVELAIGVK